MLVPPFNNLTSFTPKYLNITAALEAALVSPPYNTIVVSLVTPFALANSISLSSERRFHSGPSSYSSVLICTAPGI
ncbi:hypothetical protein [Clostridium sp. UBA5119]|uniref:hypothetical protein n=1 Tax=Clostridium sp. UBA5119 TaxID=1946366 RepID=UPI003217F1DB